MAERKLTPEIRSVLERVGKLEPLRVILELNVLPEYVRDLLEQYGRVTYVSKVAPYVGLVTNKLLLQEITLLPFVVRVWYDRPISIISSAMTNETYVNVGLKESTSFVGADALKNVGVAGKGINILLIDTGVDKDHPMLVGKVVAEKSFVEGEGPEDLRGHGTWCASCLVGSYWQTEYEGKVYELEGMATEAKLINAKAFDRRGFGTASGVMAALEWGCEQGALVSSNSWGDEFPYQPIDDLIRSLEEKFGTIFVFGAGNDGDIDCSIIYPAANPRVIAVGACAVKAPAPYSISTFSSRGPTPEGFIKPELVAPGGNHYYDEAGNEYFERLIGAAPGGSARGSMGTSMACPHVAGAVAMLLSMGYDRFTTLKKLFTSAKDIEEPGKDNKSGYGALSLTGLA
jgi:subtilisin family serine protease